MIYGVGYQETQQYDHGGVLYDTLTAAAFEAVLADALATEKTDKEEIAEEQAKIEGMKTQLALTEKTIASVIQQKYAALRISEQEISSIENTLATLEQKLQQLAAMDPSALALQGAEVKAATAYSTALAAKPISRLWVIRDRLQQIDARIEQVASRIPVVEIITEKNETVYMSQNSLIHYNPSKGDCLYTIAQNPHVYGDASKWHIIYEANKSAIDDAYKEYTKRFGASKYIHPEDLLFPNQILKIPK
jgi:nucleoid-associated protein YgaU